MSEENSKKPTKPRPVETGKNVTNSAKPLKKPSHIQPRPKNIKDKSRK